MTKDGVSGVCVRMWAHISNIQFSSDQQLPFSRLNYPAYMAMPLFGDYYMLYRRFGLFIFPIVGNDWSTPLRAAQRIDFRQSTIHLLESSTLQ